MAVHLTRSSDATEPPRADRHLRLAATARLGVADEARVPYEVGTPAAGPWQQLSAGGTDRALHWPRAHPLAIAGAFRAAGVPVFGRVVGDDEVDRLVASIGGIWSTAAPVIDASGRRVSSIRRSAAGGAVLP